MLCICRHLFTQYDVPSCCRQLLQRYPDNARYHAALRQALRLEPNADGAWDAGQLAGLQALYAELQAQYPRSTAAFRIPLDFLVRRVVTSRLHLALTSLADVTALLLDWSNSDEHMLHVLLCGCMMDVASKRYPCLPRCSTESVGVFSGMCPVHWHFVTKVDGVSRRTGRRRLRGSSVRVRAAAPSARRHVPVLRHEAPVQGPC